MGSKGRGGVSPLLAFVLGAAAATIFLVFIFSDQKTRQPWATNSPLKTKRQFNAPGTGDRAKFGDKVNKTSIEAGNRVPKKESHANQVSVISFFHFYILSWFPLLFELNTFLRFFNKTNISISSFQRYLPRKTNN
jgi:hypothetical protein